MIRASGVWWCIPSPAQNLRPAAVPITTLHGIGSIYVTKIGEERDTPHLIHHRNNSSSAHIVQMTWAAVCISVSPTPILKSTMWTLNIFPHLSRSLGAWSELLQVAAKHLALSWCIYTRHPGLASVWWPCPVCGPGVTCSWHRPIFEAPSPLPPSLRVASRRNRSAQPRARAGTFHSQPGWWPMMLNNLQFARDHSPGYKMPHCFSQSTFNKMQCGYFMIFLPSPHLSFKMGGT